MSSDRKVKIPSLKKEKKKKDKRKRGKSLNSNSTVFKTVFVSLESTESSENKKQTRFVCWRGTFPVWLHQGAARCGTRAPWGLSNGYHAPERQR